MPVTYEIRGSVLIVTLVGVCGNEVSKVITEGIADPAFQVGSSLLLDVRHCLDDPSSGELQSRAASLAARRAHGLSTRCAFVIGPKAYQFGVARMASTHAEIRGMQMEIFTDLNEALQWLSNAETPESAISDPA